MENAQSGFVEKVVIRRSRQWKNDAYKLLL